MGWNIKECRQLSERRLSPAAVEELDLPLASIPWKFHLCRYHSEEVDRILAAEFSLPDNQRSVEAVGKILHTAAGTEEGTSFKMASFQAEAHLIAFAGALHSTADILAQVFDRALQLETEKKTRRRLSLFGVLKQMRKHRELDRIARATEELIESREFLYLRAYVNTTKHISLVPSAFSAHVEPPEMHGLKIAAFRYDSEAWPMKWVADFIGAEFERLSLLVGRAGTELNRELRRRSSSTASE